MFQCGHGQLTSVVALLLVTESAVLVFDSRLGAEGAGSISWLVLDSYRYPLEIQARDVCKEKDFKILMKIGPKTFLLQNCQVAFKMNNINYFQKGRRAGESFRRQKYRYRYLFLELRNSLSKFFLMLYLKFTRKNKMH